jgi:hypothetical protein
VVGDHLLSLRDFGPYLIILVFIHAFVAVVAMVRYGIRIFNSLLKNKKTQFKVTLKWYLNTHSFYSADEFIMFEKTHDVFKGFLFYILHYMGSLIYICIYVDLYVII